MKHLEDNLSQAILEKEPHKLYSAYLWRAVVRMLYTTGLRNFELRGLTYENLNIPELYGNIIGKGAKNAIITFSRTAAEKLKEYLAIRDSYFPEINFEYIFTLYEHGQASKLTEQKLNIALKQLAAKAGIKQNVSAHIFRHSLATNLLADGRTILNVKTKLRHANISVTSTYLHANPDEVKKQTSGLGDDLMT